MSYGVTEFGFRRKTLEVLILEMEADLRTRFGASFPLGDNTLAGQVVRAFAEQPAILWEVAEQAYSAMDPDLATGPLLDAIAAITGTVREPAQPSVAEMILTGDVGTTVPVAALVATESTDIDFAIAAQATLAAADVYIPLGTTYETGAVVMKVDGTVTPNVQRIFVAVSGGTIANALTGADLGQAIVDGACTWAYVGDGAGYVFVEAISVEKGEIPAAAFDLSKIKSPQAGLLAAVNWKDAVLGRDRETDEALRRRREDEIGAAGSSTPEAIRADTLDVPGVTAVTAFINNTDVTDGDGLPPHSVELLVQGGEQTEIAASIFNSGIAAGIYTHGTVSETVTDSQGFAHTIRFSRPTPVNVYAVATITYDADTYPDDGDDQVEAAIIAYGNSQKTGKDVVASALVAQAFKVAGVLDASVTIGTAPAPVGTAPIVITLRQLAAYDSARVSVVSAAGVP